MESLAGKVESIAVVTLSASKDISEYLSGFKTDAEKKSAIEWLIKNAPVFTKGINIPIQSIHEIEHEYIRFLDETKDNCLNLGAWLPSLNYYRPIAPGELVTLISDTGQGKTASMQNIALAARPNPVLMFEIELPAPIMFERFAAIDNDAPQSRIEDEYREGLRANTVKMAHIWTCTVSQLTVHDIDKYIMQSEMKIGRKPALVMIDYVGLLQGVGNRYERLSDAAERLKVIAKKTKTIIVIASQIHRKSDDAAEEIFLHDAKDSGAIENSSQVVFGMWRDTEDTSGETLTVKVLKYTRGKAGRKIKCNFNGQTLKITERAERQDV
jgi:replicative DNA helicase